MLFLFYFISFFFLPISFFHMRKKKWTANKSKVILQSQTCIWGETSVNRMSLLLNCSWILFDWTQCLLSFYLTFISSQFCTFQPSVWFVLFGTKCFCIVLFCYFLFSFYENGHFDEITCSSFVSLSACFGFDYSNLAVRVQNLFRCFQYWCVSTGWSGEESMIFCSADDLDISTAKQPLLNDMC